MLNSQKVQDYIDKWMNATKAELRNRLITLQTKNKSTKVQAEIVAIKTLLL